MEGILESATKEAYKWFLLNVNGYTKEEIEEMDFESQQLLDIIYDEV